MTVMKIISDKDAWDNYENEEENWGKGIFYGERLEKKFSKGSKIEMNSPWITKFSMKLQTLYK